MGLELREHGKALGGHVWSMSIKRQRRQSLRATERLMGGSRDRAYLVSEGRRREERMGEMNRGSLWLSVSISSS